MVVENIKLLIVSSIIKQLIIKVQLPICFLRLRVLMVKHHDIKQFIHIHTLYEFRTLSHSSSQDSSTFAHGTVYYGQRTVVTSFQ